MSVPAVEPVEPESVDLPHGDGAFAVLMDTLVADPEGSSPAEGAASTGDAAPAAGGAGGAGAAAAGGAAPAPTGEPAGAAAAASTGAAAAGDVGDQGADAGAGAEGAAATDAGSGGGARPEAWTADAATLTANLGEISVQLEERTFQGYQAAALEEVKTEHAKYFEALQTHPRLLVGAEVPKIGAPGTETLRSSEDAKEWQEAVKSILVKEVNSRAETSMESSRDMLATVHASIELFQNNHDLVPGAKEFDVDLANRFATLAKPYELRVDGKLQGYTIPVQPIIDQLRSQLVTERAAKTTPPAAASPAAGGAPAPAAAAAAPPAPAAEPPQAGIPSKAGGSGDAREDFSTLFGTLGSAYASIQI